MDAKEEVLQHKKIDLIVKMVVLLEEIAFNTSSKMVERSTYLERIYASGLPKSTEVHGDVRTQPTARSGEVSKHDTSPVPRVRSDANPGSPQTKDPSRHNDGRK